MVSSHTNSLWECANGGPGARLASVIDRGSQSLLASFAGEPVAPDGTSLLGD
jgi:hypothetical protein